MVAIVGVGALKLQTDHEEQSRKKIEAYTNDPTEFLSAIVNDEKAKPAVYVKGSVATVVLNLDAWTPKYQLKLFEGKVAIATPMFLAKFPQISSIDYLGQATFVDVRGNETRDWGMKVSFSRQNAATIRWDGIMISDLPQLADAFWVHPGISRE